MITASICSPITPNASSAAMTASKKASRPIMHVPDRVEAPFHRRCASSNSAVVSNSAVSAQSLAAELSEVKSILSTRERELTLSAEIGQQLLLANNALQASYEGLLLEQQQQGHASTTTAYTSPRILNLRPHSKTPVKPAQTQESDFHTTSDEPFQDQPLPSWTPRRLSKSVQDPDTYVLQLEKTNMDIQNELTAADIKYKALNVSYQKQIQHLESTIAVLQDEFTSVQEKYNVIQLDRKKSIQVKREAQRNKMSTVGMDNDIMESLVTEKEVLQAKLSKKLAQLSLTESRLTSALAENECLRTDLLQLIDTNAENIHLRNINNQQESQTAHLQLQLESYQLEITRLHELVQLRDAYNSLEVEQSKNSFGLTHMLQKSKSSLSLKLEGQSTLFDTEQTHDSDAICSFDQNTTITDPTVVADHQFKNESLSTACSSSRLCKSPSLDTLSEDQNDTLVALTDNPAETDSDLFYTKCKTIATESEAESDDAYYTPARTTSPTHALSKNEPELYNASPTAPKATSLADSLLLLQPPRHYHPHSFHAPYPTLYPHSQLYRSFHLRQASGNIKQQNAGDPLHRIHQIVSTASLEIGLASIDSGYLESSGYNSNHSTDSHNAMSGSDMLGELLHSCLHLVKRVLGLPIPSGNADYVARKQRSIDRLNRMV
ncbi:hypothetical protein O5D80_002163 [Batrachochytrium dendrobatidis]|nr:hypothetical protein O5D80_002163 [Batrachochytrium dendrobatidis]